MALKKQATPKCWRSKEAKEIVAAVQRAGGAHGERASAGRWAGRVRRRRLSPQQRPRRWARCPQHPGHDVEQDRAGGVSVRPGRRRMLELSAFERLLEEGQTASPATCGANHKQSFYRVFPLPGLSGVEPCRLSICGSAPLNRPKAVRERLSCGWTMRGGPKATPHQRRRRN
jgi:hypothetical protein